MTQEEKIEILADALDRDIDEVQPEAELDSLGWDSMAMLSVIAMAKARFNRKLSGSQIREFTTVKDILDVMQAE